jgi:WD40 repeat protein/tetratricopeptide (TPR) repeat protein
MATAAISVMNPYPGPRPFERTEAHLFFGRSYEVRELFSLATAHRAVLMYAQSGAGKSSLLNAGLIPALLNDGFEVLPVARVRGLIPYSIDTDTVPNPYVLNTLLSWSEADAEPRQLLDCSVAQFLEARPGAGDVRILIFDQFEELFTFYSERWREREPFFRQIADALENDTLLRILFVMREEYIAQLDSYRHLLPEDLEIRFRLERLGSEAALAAVTEPLKGTSRRFAADAAKQLIEDLLRVRITTEQNTTKEVIGDYVEPVQLQVVCEGLWHDLPEGVEEITVEHLRNSGDVTEALSDFYEKCVREAAREAGVNEGRLRNWFEHTLLTPAGTRGTVFRGARETGGIPNAAVAVLDRLHIIRGESRAGATWYELTHDRFIEPIQQSNKHWRAQRGEADQLCLEARAAEWQRLGRPVDKLLSDVELQVARRWMDGPDAAELGISDAADDYVMASTVESQRIQGEEQRHIAEKQARAAARLRRLAGALVMAVFVAAALGLTAWLKRAEAVKNAITATAAQRTALTEKERAESERKIAEDATRKAKAEAERADAVSRQLLVLSFVHEKEADEAKRETYNIKRETLSNDLAAVAARNVNTDSSSGAALALRAMLVSPSPRAEEALSQVVHMAPAASLPGGDIASAVLTPDGAQVAIGRKDGRADLFDLVSGRSIPLALGLGTKPVLATSRNGNRLAWAGGGAAIGWRDIGSSATKMLPARHAAMSLALSSSGSWLASGCEDGTIEFWELASSESAPAASVSLGQSVRALAFNADGTRLAAAGSDGVARIWNTSASARQATPGQVPWKPEDKIDALDFSPDNSRIAAAGLDGTVRVWDAASLELMLTLSGHTGEVRTVAFSPDGTRLVTGGADSKIKIWDAVFGHELQSLSGYRPEIAGFGLSRDGVKLLAGAHIWNVGGTYGLPVLSHAGAIRSVSFSGDGRFLATGGASGIARVWNSRSGEEIIPAASRRHDGTILDVALSPDGKRLAAAGSDKTARIWDTVSGKELRVLQHPQMVMAVAFNPKGDLVATGGYDGVVRIWSVESGAVLKQLRGHVSWVLGVEFSPDGARLASCGFDKTARVWEVAPEKQLFSLRGHSEQVNAVTFSRDGRYIATASGDRTARLWEAADGKAIRTFSGHVDRVAGVALSPDGKRLATASYDRTAKIWDAASGVNVVTLRDHASQVNVIAFSPDGTRLVTAGNDRTTRTFAAGKGLLTALASERIVTSFQPEECRGREDFCMAGEKALSLIAQGNAAAREGDIGRAVEKFRQAQLASTDLSLDPELQAKRVATQELILRSRGLARAGNIAEATDILRRARERDPGLPFDDAWPSRQAAMPRLARAQMLARADNLEAAVKMLQSAQMLDPSLTFSPEAEAARFAVPVLLERGRRAATEADVESALRLLRKVKDLDRTLSLDPVAEVRLRAVPVLLDRGRTAARAQEIEKAANFLRDAKGLDGTLTFAPDTEAKRLAAAALVTQAQVLANSSIDEAVSVFQRAKSLDAKLTFDPLTEANRLAAAALVAQAHTVARMSDTAKATALFARAKSLDPKLTFDPATEANRSLAVAIVAQAQTTAKTGEAAQAAALFQQAKFLDAKLSFDPIAEANRLAAEALASKARATARTGDAATAISLFQQAKSLDTKLVVEPVAEANRLAAAALTDRGRRALDAGDAGAALAAFRKVKPLDPKFDVEKEMRRGDARRRVNQGMGLAQEGKIKPAVEAFAEAKRIDASVITQDEWNYLCWQGAVRSFARDVIEACETAVALVPGSAHVRDSRGVALALLGKFKDAAEDFAAFIKASDDDERKAQRQVWIKVLSQGRSPFTPEVLRSIADQ